MNSSILMRITLLCVLPMTFTACGWIFVNGPPPNHERLNFFTCSQSRVAPGVDLVWTGLSALVVVTVLASSDFEIDRDFGMSKSAVAGVYASWGALTGFSAASGFKKVSECRDATSLLMERLSRPPNTSAATPILGSATRVPFLPPSRRAR
jgi:hypothetical protein